MKKVLVLGAGTWGIALATAFRKNENEVSVWSYKKSQVDYLNETHIYDKFDNLKLDQNIKFVSDENLEVKNFDIIIFVVPSTAFREVAKKIIPKTNDKQILVTATKGIEDNTLYTMSEILEDELKINNIKNTKVVALSGPTHAEEVVLSMPTAIVSASNDLNAASTVQNTLMYEDLRVYTNDDIRGVEVCAAFKNIIAIACGITRGLGAGDNIKAAIIVRGLAEMIRLGEKLGCKKDTFYGLAGIGDMIVTSMSPHSRNNRFGEYIGSGMSVSEAIKKVGQVVEGVNLITKAHTLIQKYNIEMPITEGMYKVIIENVNAKDIVNVLMTRDKKKE